MGNELEVQLNRRVSTDEGVIEIAFESHALQRALVTYRHERNKKHGVFYQTGRNNPERFNSTGSMDYVDCGLLEEATAECEFVHELVPRTQQHEQFGIDLAKILAHDSGEMVFLHLRTADAHKRSSGCHDTMGVEGLSPKDIGDNIDRGFLGHLAVRNIFTGAGLIMEDGMYFSQKLRWLTHDKTISAQNGGYSVKGDKGGAVVEIRCSDFNLLPSAARMRLGFSRIALLLAMSPLKSHLEDFTRIHAQPLKDGAARFNKIPLDPDGEIIPRDVNTIMALGEQMRQLELFLSNTHYFEESPQLEELRGIAEDGLIVGERAFKVMTGGDLDLIADDIDWAAKLKLTKHLMERDRKKGMRRTLFDHRGQYSDLTYDVIVVTWLGKSESGEDTYKVVRGNGYTNRERRLGMLTTAEAAQIALKPPNTRASIRGGIIAEYQVISCEWDRMWVNSGDRKRISVSLPNALTSQLPPEKLQDLEMLGNRRAKN